jgi:hypothetical protein
MHQISTKNDTTVFRANKIPWLNLTVKYSFHLSSVGLLGFVGFVLNLLNRPTDGATFSIAKCVRKSASEKELLFVRLGVRKITFFIKGA